MELCVVFSFISITSEKQRIFHVKDAQGTMFLLLQMSTGNKEHVEISNPKDVKTETYFAPEYNLASKKSRKATIILLKKEIESALGSLQGVQDQMAKLIFEHEEILATGKHSKENIEVLMNRAVLLQGTIDSFDEDLQLRVNAFDGKLGKMEETLQEACASWSQHIEVGHSFFTCNVNAPFNLFSLDEMIH